MLLMRGNYLVGYTVLMIPINGSNYSTGMRMGTKTQMELHRICILHKLC